MQRALALLVRPHARQRDLRCAGRTQGPPPRTSLESSGPSAGPWGAAGKGVCVLVETLLYLTVGCEKPMAA